jgi:hypothetical protein
LRNNSTNSLFFIPFLIGIKWAILVKWYIIMHTEVNPFEFGKRVMKSIAMVSQEV